MEGHAPALIALALGWVAYCGLHSLLIHPPVAARLTGLMGRRAGAYRFLYSAFSLAALVPLLWAHVELAGPPVIAWRGAWAALPLTLDVGAVALFVLGAAAYRPSDFLGLGALREALAGRPAPAPEPFSTRGILRWVRHPWYSGSFLVLWGHDLDAAGLVAAAILTAYLVGGTRLEERKLVAQFGDAYRDYQRRVPMFVPRPPRARPEA